MKEFYRVNRILLSLLISQQYLQAQVAKVFSRYNYYTSENEIAVIAEFLPGIAGANYNLSIFKDNKLVGKTGTLKNNSLTIQSPLSSFKNGTTTLHYAIAGIDQPVQQGEIDIVRLPPKTNEVKIDLETGGLICDGLPFFPMGFYCRPVLNLPEQEISHGFNLIAPYQSNLPDGFEERKSYMDRCARIGMKVQYAVNSLVGSGHNGAKAVDMTEEQKQELLEKEITAFRDHPALLSWYINDEPDGQGRPTALIEKVYKIVHELDPYHPVSIVFMIPPKFHLFRNSMDIAMTDPYPIPGPVTMVEEYVQQMNKDFRHEKSVWLVPQAFGGQEMWAREPTAKEIRLMTYLGLVNGVKGIQYYTHAAGNLNPQSVSAWSVCSDMAVEVNQMTSFLLSAEQATPVTASGSTILARSFSYKGDLLIIAVNKENKPGSFSLRVNELKGEWAASTKALLWFENREVEFHNGKIEDIIDAMGTRVYLLKGNTRTDSTGIYPANLTFNPGFEKIISPGLPIGSNTKKSFPGKADTGASFFADSRQAVEGMFSLRLITPVDSTGNKIRLLPIVIRAKNSYVISVWAKAKTQDKLPVFRLSIDATGLEKTFTSTRDWQQYSFIIHPDADYSSAIVCLDLLTAGTAWFDLIQVTPDPVINYKIVSQVATVAVNSTIPGATIKYSVHNKSYDGKTVYYKQPFFVDKASEVYAEVSDGDRVVAEASLFIPVNKALGKKITLQNKYAPQYASQGDSSLTDGAMGTTAFKDGKWLGFSDIDVIATIDMEKVVAIHSVTADFLADPNSGIFLPPHVLLYTSQDGKNFRLTDTFENRAGSPRKEPWLQPFTLTGKNLKARYVRLVAKAFGEIPEGYLFKGTKSWIFIDEIMVE